eukprot:1817589-Alexandrium_andersonii.AAC.1
MSAEAHATHPEHMICNGHWGKAWDTMYTSTAHPRMRAHTHARTHARTNALAHPHTHAPTHPQGLRLRP